MGSIYLDTGAHSTSNLFEPRNRDPRNQPRANPIREARTLLQRRATGAPGQVSYVLFMGTFTIGPNRPRGALGVMVASQRQQQGRPRFKRMGFCTFSANMVDRIMTQELQCDLI